MGKTYEFTINGRLPGMNQWINAQNTNRYKGAQMKKEAQDLCYWQAMQQLKNIRIRKPVIIHYIWYEKNTRRDLDNISGFGHKVIQDALVKAQVLKDDGWKEVAGYTDTFAVDRENPRIVIMLEVVDDEM